MSQRSASPHSDKNFPLNKRKRITKPRVQQSQKISQTGQSKITHFFKSVHKKPNPPKPAQKLKTQLQQQLEKLKQYEQALMVQKQQIIQQQNKIKKQYQLWIKKSRGIVHECLCEIYTSVRADKGKINPEFGFFDVKGSIYHQGSIGIPEKERLVMLRSHLNNLNNSKEEQMNEDQKQILTQFIISENDKFKFYKKQLQKYKQRLRNSNQQKVCKFANSWPFLSNRYQVLELLGKGGFSEVYKAYDIQQNKFVAVKLSSISGIKGGQLAHYVLREYENHLKLDHPNIVKMYEVVQMSNGSACIILEYCDGPDLYTYIKQKTRLSQYKARIVIKQILQALNYLNNLTPKIVHYDIKPPNIMFCKGKVKILDFGLSRQLDNQHSKIELSNQGIGTCWYLPPQTFNQKNPQITSKVDIWSAGVVLYEMLFGKKPFGHNKSHASIYKEGIILDANKVQFPDDIQVTDEVKSLIEGCLAYNYQQRFTPEEALAHQFFQLQFQ